MIAAFLNVSRRSYDQALVCADGEPVALLVGNDLQWSESWKTISAQTSLNLQPKWKWRIIRSWFWLSRSVLPENVKRLCADLQGSKIAAIRDRCQWSRLPLDWCQPRTWLYCRIRWSAWNFVKAEISGKGVLNFAWVEVVTFSNSAHATPASMGADVLDENGRAGSIIANAAESVLCVFFQPLWEQHARLLSIRLKRSHKLRLKLTS